MMYHWIKQVWTVWVYFYTVLFNNCNIIWSRVVESTDAEPQMQKADYVSWASSNLNIYARCWNQFSLDTIGIQVHWYLYMSLHYTGLAATTSALFKGQLYRQ